MLPKFTPRRVFLRGLFSGSSLAIVVPHLTPTASIPLPSGIPAPKFKIGDTVYSEFGFDTKPTKYVWWKGVICGIIWNPDDIGEWGYVGRWNGEFHEFYIPESGLEDDMKRFKEEGKL